MTSKTVVVGSRKDQYPTTLEMKTLPAAVAKEIEDLKDVRARAWKGNMNSRDIPAKFTVAKTFRKEAANAMQKIWSLAMPFLELEEVLLKIEEDNVELKASEAKPKLAVEALEPPGKRQRMEPSDESESEIDYEDHEESEGEFSHSRVPATYLSESEASSAEDSEDGESVETQKDRQARERYSKLQAKYRAHNVLIRQIDAERCMLTMQLEEKSARHQKAAEDNGGLRGTLLDMQEKCNRLRGKYYAAKAAHATDVAGLTEGILRSDANMKSVMKSMTRTVEAAKSSCLL